MAAGSPRSTLCVTRAAAAQLALLACRNLQRLQDDVGCRAHLHKSAGAGIQGRLAETPADGDGNDRPALLPESSQQIQMVVSTRKDQVEHDHTGIERLVALEHFVLRTRLTDDNCAVS